ncbi:ABC transporter ATP-binding protein [Hazenella coriacea]|uniref:ABC-2 type transport system ATP-binding protein n=1 Tax=Hazenella coriacea TaxID=1179467 RepID=A0A4R3L7L3_9BACL|nr:ABC transporter ATP-binding protein [Hazenella coriacea]TCS94204.1 ABC-2 type transport system ATP-binding protein [Hazenella coriacea]
MIILQDIYKKWNSFTFGPMDIDIQPGLIYAVVGSNGSGKTTLFNLIMNLIKPDDGEIQLFNQTYPDHEVHIKQKIGYVPYSFLGNPTWTVNQVVQFTSHWYPTWNQTLCDSLFEQMGINRNIAIGKLSSGTQKKCLLSLALSIEPSLLLLDEPTNGLDFTTKQLVIEKCNQWMETGERSILLATHDLHEVQKVADYLILLDQGQHLGTFEKDQLLQDWAHIWLDPSTESDIELETITYHSDTKYIITHQREKAVKQLQSAGIQIRKIKSMSLEEIIPYLVQQQ